MAGQSPLVPPGMLPHPFIPPDLPPPPTSPSLGFQTWASDPQNAHKVVPAMVAPDAPLQPNASAAPGASAGSALTPPLTQTQQRMKDAFTPPGGFKKQLADTSANVNAAPSEDVSAPVLMPSSAPTILPPDSGRPAVQSQLGADRGRLQDLQTQGAGVNKIKNPLLRTLAKVGDIAAPMLLGKGAMAIPGTTAHNLWLQGQQEGRVEDDQAAMQNDMQQRQNAANLEHTNAETANLPVMAALKRQQASSNLAQHGLKLVADPNDPSGANEIVVPDESSPVFQRQQIQNSYIQSRQGLAEAQSSLAAAKTAGMDPASPQFKLLQQKVQAEMQRTNMAARSLGLQEERLAFEQDKQYNPQPTANQRVKGDLAQSAVNQVQTMRQIVQAHPEVFGPVQGRTTNAAVWLGSQSPDAQTFLSAKKYLADHSAGVFGARSVQIVHDLESLTDPKMNTDALNAALDRAEQTSQHFVDVGKVHGKPGANPTAAPSTGGNQPAPSATKSGNQSPSAQPTIGTTKLFPNGKTGIWDGTGWVAQ